jgi:hypothetical protein
LKRSSQDAAFDDLAVAPELGLVLEVAAGNADLDPSPVQRSAAAW